MNIGAIDNASRNGGSAGVRAERNDTAEEAGSCRAGDSHQTIFGIVGQIVGLPIHDARGLVAIGIVQVLLNPVEMSQRMGVSGITVAEDYFTAMARVEQRLEIVPAEQKDIDVVKVQEPVKVLQLIEQLEIPELCYRERLDIASRLRELFGTAQEFEPALVLA